MNIETEIKLFLKDIDIDHLVQKIEKNLSLEKAKEFHQVTHQFFENDFSKQTVFPRIRNEENGEITLTVKAKIKGEENSDFFKRIELETNISNIENVCEMMSIFGFTQKISWEKIRTNFTSKNKEEFSLSIDETPMGFFLEIESNEEKIKELIKTLGLEDLKTSKKSYLGIWEDYKLENKVSSQYMMFSESRRNSLME